MTAKPAKKKKQPTGVTLESAGRLAGHRRHAAEVNRSLEAIYEKDGRVDFDRLERRPTSRWMWPMVAFAVIVVCIGLVGSVGAHLLDTFQREEPVSLEMRIFGPETVTLGAEQAYRVELTQRGPVALEDVRVRLSLPADFHLTVFEPVPQNKDLAEWVLGDIPVGWKGQVAFRGRYTGSLGSQATLQVIGAYRLASGGREKQALAVQSFLCSATVLEARAVVPANVWAGDRLEITYSVINRGDQAMGGYSVRVVPPAGFTLESDVFSLGELAPKTVATVRVRGSLASGSSGPLPLAFEIGKRGADGEFHVAQKTETVLPVLAGDLGLGLVVNGSSADRSIDPGEPLTIAISYQNTSVETLKNVWLRIGFESIRDGVSVTGTSLIDWPLVQADQVTASSSRSRIQTIRFDLPTLSNQADGVREVYAPTLRPKKGVKDAAIRLTLEGFIGEIGGKKVQRAVFAQPITLRYRSDVQLKAEARYFTEEGAPIGSGPLPPQVGKPTSYRVVWTIKKQLHALRDVVVSAALPSSVTVSAGGSTDVGMVTFDPTTRIVTWRVDQMPADQTEIEGSFTVVLTPTSQDVGRFARLLEESVFQSEDVHLIEMIQHREPALTTDLQNDEGAVGKGVVKK